MDYTILIQLMLAKIFNAMDKFNNGAQFPANAWHWPNGYALVAHNVQ